MAVLRIWAPLVLALVLNAAANIMMKIGSKAAPQLAEGASVSDRIAAFLNAATVVGIALFAANVLVYRKALDNLDISVAYPMMVTGGLILVTLAATMLPALAEKISALQITGMIFVGIGVWLVAGG